MIDALAYVRFTSPAARAWRSFGPEVLGLQPADDGADGAVRFRIDDKAWRLEIAPGDTDDLDAIGWMVAGPDALADAAQQLETAGVTVHRDHALATERSVEDVVWFTDPFGFRHELIHGQADAATPFTPGRDMVDGFVTGDAGLGHIVLIVPDLDAASDFFFDTLGFAHSDDIDNGLLIRFAHCNPRHHSLAFSAVPGMTGVHHLMLEVADEIDVGTALDIVAERDLTLAMTLGRHTNDHMFSFYVRTPSGFEIEYGSGGRRIEDDDTWQVGHYDAISVWGHRPPGELLLPGILEPMGDDA